MLNPGDLLQNRYGITALLGQGGMGAVYRARDQRLNQDRVVKEMLITDIAADVSRGAKQFQREAETLASLHHTNLPGVYDYFLENDHYYIVMDFIEGDNLGKLIGPTGITESTVLGYADQLLQVLEYIHSQGVVHRDIKPGNIVVHPNGHVVLVDFGLVKVIDPVQATRSFMALTPQYAPPEQMTGGTDQRSDLYSLAATLYHALTGHAPLQFSDRTAGIRTPGIRELNPAVSKNTDLVVMKAFNLNRNERFGTATAMRASLIGKVKIPVAPTPMATAITTQAMPAEGSMQAPKRAQADRDFRKLLPIGAAILLAGILALLIVPRLFMISATTPEMTPGSPAHGALPPTVANVVTPTSFVARTPLPSAESTITVVQPAATAKPATPIPNTKDDIQVISVVPASGVTLKTGQATDFQILLKYALVSVDQAIVIVYLEEYPQSVGACTGSVNMTNGGTEVPISRGTGELHVLVHWLRDPNGLGGKDIITKGAGYINPGVNLFTANNGSPDKLIRAFGAFPGFCNSFSM